MFLHCNVLVGVKTYIATPYIINHTPCMGGGGEQLSDVPARAVAGVHQTMLATHRGLGGGGGGEADR